MQLLLERGAVLKPVHPDPTFGITADAVIAACSEKTRVVAVSMVQYVDGGIMAQLGVPDMKLPIQYALFYPDRKPMNGGRVDFARLGQMTFEEPDTEVFSGLRLAYEALKVGGSMPTVYNAANEKAVSLFLNRQIGYTQITELIEGAMNRHKVIVSPDVAQILSVEQETYEYIMTEV